MENTNNQSNGIFSPVEKYRMVWFLGWAAININLVMFAVKAITGGLNLRVGVFFVFFTVVIGSVVWLARRRFRYSIQAFFISVELLIPMIIYNLGTMQTQVVTIYIMVIFIMGLLEGRRGIILSTIVSIVTLAAVGFSLNGFNNFIDFAGAVFVSQALAFIFTGLLSSVVDSVLHKNKFELDKYKNLVQQSPLSIVIFDLAGKVEYVNDSFTRTTGFTPEDVKQITAHDFTRSTLTKEQYKDFWTTIRDGKTWKGEVLATTKFGVVYHEKLIVLPILDRSGNPIYFSAINENIDQRKRDEISLRKAHSDLQEKLEEITKLQHSLQEQIIHDSLTGLYNRRFFTEVIDREIHRSEREKTKLSLIVLDIDHFKQVNDTYGHIAGDDVLRQLAKFLTNNVRKMDIVCRYGGEEFVIVMPGAFAKIAADRANALRDGISTNKMVIGDHDIQITCSFGICAYPEFAGSVDELLSRADIAMYASKLSGRNNCVIWDPHMNADSLAVPG